ncbi:MAG TPA: hypothetical protein PKY82_27990 [Pyrinomonadaceae bacterium]|nr:hypothetical protein [Pyrinomonadaceae bacterium]
MKIKVYLFRLIAGVVTLTLGIGIYFIWQALITVNPIVKVTPVIESSQTVSEIKQSENEAVENTEDEFYPDGEYYLITDSLENFEDLDNLQIEAHEYITKKDGTSDWKPIPPKGYFLRKSKFKFTRIAIANREISFETQKIKGISYKFTGYYPKNLSFNDGEDFVAIQGVLSKYKDGKKISEMEVKFREIDGC